MTVGTGGDRRVDGPADGAAPTSRFDEPVDEPAGGRTRAPWTGGPRGHRRPASWPTLRRALRPRASRPQAIVGLLCGLLGFALVVQVRQTQVEGLASLPQAELVRILDQAQPALGGARAREAAALEATREELLTGSDQQQAALEAATEAADHAGHPVRPAARARARAWS